MQIIEKGFRLAVSLDIVFCNFLVYKFLLSVKVTAGQKLQNIIKNGKKSVHFQYLSLTCTFQAREYVNQFQHFKDIYFLPTCKECITESLTIT